MRSIVLFLRYHIIVLPQLFFARPMLSIFTLGLAHYALKIFTPGGTLRGTLISAEPMNTEEKISMM